MKTRSTFVFVPGAWHGAWCFRDVARMLREQGHEVHALTLTGLGDRAHLAHPDIDLDSHIDDVMAVIDAEELSDIFLVGHSYGGFVISGVAERRPDKIRSLVYLDAIVPKDGERLFDHLSPEFQAGVIAGAEAQGQGYLVPIPSMDFLAIGPEHADWMKRRLTPQPLKTATQILNLGPSDPRIERIYIHCSSPSMEPTHLTKARIVGEAGWTHHEIPSGHDAFITMPAAVTEVLSQIEQISRAVPPSP